MTPPAPRLARVTLVLLVRPPDAPSLPAAELERLQAAHLDFLRAMGERGALLVAGPFDQQEDQSYRGLCLYRTDVEETRRLASEDPLVRAGRLRPQVMDWWYPPEDLARAASAGDT